MGFGIWRSGCTMLRPRVSAMSLAEDLTGISLRQSVAGWEFPINGGLNGKMSYQWWPLHCHVWLPDDTTIYYNYPGDITNRYGCSYKIPSCGDAMAGFVQLFVGNLPPRVQLYFENWWSMSWFWGTRPSDKRIFFITCFWGNGISPPLSRFSNNANVVNLP